MTWASGALSIRLSPKARLTQVELVSRPSRWGFPTHPTWKLFKPSQANKDFSMETVLLVETGILPWQLLSLTRNVVLVSGWLWDLAKSWFGSRSLGKRPLQPGWCTSLQQNKDGNSQTFWSQASRSYFWPSIVTSEVALMQLFLMSSLSPSQFLGRLYFWCGLLSSHSTIVK